MSSESKSSSKGPPPQQLVRVVSESSMPKGHRWSPAVGEETLELLEHLNLPKDGADRVRDEAASVLARCVPPTASAQVDTGLAVGYVQSGKTMSFTTVAALARDNGYQIVIIIAGTSKPLLAQSTDRLMRDLRIDGDNRGWQLFESRALTKAALPGVRLQLQATLDAWKGSVPLPMPWMRRTVLIMTMKHHQHLDRVTALLDGLDLKRVPVLVIDDEADQASLNAAVRRQDETKTYARIKGVRERLPHHTFLQYTATPQAPLLLNIIDSLSPRFTEVLTPGADYVGGKDFFLNAKDNLVREIPDEEMPGDEAPECAPESLLSAMRLFFIGAAAGVVKEKRVKGNRSMMVHPSQERIGHSEYYSWVTSVRTEWAKMLTAGPEYDEDRKELLAEFDAAYDDIASTVGDDMPTKDDVFKMLPWTVANTVVQEVNSRAGETPKVNWKANYAHILVGGQAMDRGFTVEGLTVTYMPRSLGVGNADTIQQRARFFGYKRPYLGYCRVFLEKASIDAYRRYVRHEEDIRWRLIAHRATGKPLSAWKRAFFLDKSLKPTRSTVLELDYFRGNTAAKEWFTPRMPHEGAGSEDDPVAENRAIVAELRASLAALLSVDRGHADRTDYQKHLAARVPLRVVFEECLVRLRFTDPVDSKELTVLQILLAELLDRVPDQECLLYVMSQGIARDRTVDDEGSIKNLFQGAAPTKPAADVGSVYPGDRALVATDVPTIQIHYLDIYSPPAIAGNRARGDLIARDVPTIAAHLPASVAEDLLIQPQPAQR